MEGVGGICLFEMEGEFSLGENGDVTVFAAKKGDLPPGAHALLGNKHLKDLFVSLDLIQFRGEVEIEEALSFGRSFSSRFDPLHRSEALSLASIAPVPVSKLGSVFFDIPSMLCLALSLLFALAIWPSVSFDSIAPLSTTMEPRALVVSLVCLSLARVFWLSFELASSRLKAETWPPATKSIVNAVPVPRIKEACKFAPSLSPNQEAQCKSVNDRLAHVFAHHYLGLSQHTGPPGLCPKPFETKRRIYSDRSYPPTLARRAPIASATRRPAISPSKEKFAPRKLPLSKPRKARKLRTSVHANPAPTRGSPRRVSMGGKTTTPRGLRGWETTPPLGPGTPLYDSIPLDPGQGPQHIFASVPELDFAWRQETFGQHSTVVEKMHLLARPRSRESTHASAKQPRRGFMMQVVRGEIARAMIRQQKVDSSESSSVEPLVPRAQWMVDTPPYATKEEADRIWRQIRFNSSRLGTDLGF